MDYQNCLGQWQNSYIHTKGVQSVRFFERDNALYIEVEGIEGGLVSGKWPVIPCVAYAANVDSKTPIAFQANYSSDTFNAYLQFNINQRLLILAMVVDFKDNSTKSGVFIREFFGLQS